MPKFAVTVVSCPFPQTVTFAFVSDIHKTPFPLVLSALRENPPTAILLGGDIAEDGDLQDFSSPVYSFLSDCAKIAPTFYALGNHELGAFSHHNLLAHPKTVPLPDAVKNAITQTGVTLLDNAYVKWNGFVIGGLSSQMGHEKEENAFAMLKDFEKEDGYRILLCHHPEYFKKRIAPTSVELTLSGHAHGGQWRFFGIPVFAPGQGIFPKLTSGFHFNRRLYISRGMGDHTKIPRIANPRELVYLQKEESQ